VSRKVLFLKWLARLSGQRERWEQNKKSIGREQGCRNGSRAQHNETEDGLSELILTQ